MKQACLVLSLSLFISAAPMHADAATGKATKATVGSKIRRFANKHFTLLTTSFTAFNAAQNFASGDVGWGLVWTGATAGVIGLDVRERMKRKARGIKMTPDPDWLDKKLGPIEFRLKNLVKPRKTSSFEKRD